MRKCVHKAICNFLHKDKSLTLHLDLDIILGQVYSFKDKLFWRKNHRNFESRLSRKLTRLSLSFLAMSSSSSLALLSSFSSPATVSKSPENEHIARVFITITSYDLWCVVSEEFSPNTQSHNNKNMCQIVLCSNICDSKIRNQSTCL